MSMCRIASPSKRLFIGCCSAAALLSFYAYHVHYLAFVKFNYSYNMKANVTAGIVNQEFQEQETFTIFLLLWILQRFSVMNTYLHYFNLTLHVSLPLLQQKSAWGQSWKADGSGMYPWLHWFTCVQDQQKAWQVVSVVMHYRMYNSVRLCWLKPQKFSIALS